MSLAATLRLGASNVYLLAADADLLAIDAGPDYEGVWAVAEAQMAAAGVSPRSVQRILVTHGHPDHCALAATWQREAGATIDGPAGDLPRLRAGGREGAAERDLALNTLALNGMPAALIATTRARRGSGRRSMAQPDAAPARLGNLRSVAPEHGDWPAPLRATPVAPDRLLQPGETLRLGPLRLQSLHCPGHTPASTVFLDDATGDLYTGDHVLERIAPTPGIHFDAAGRRLPSLSQYLRSLDALRPLAPRRVLPGHGAPFADLAGAIERTQAVFNQRARRALRRLTEGPATAYDLALRLYPHLRPEALWVVMAEVIGLLDLLEERGDVEPERGDTLLFRAQTHP